jgi:hypothetical protein
METIEYKNHNIEIEQEDGGDFNPREWDIKDRLKKHLGKLKTQIQNKVPVQYRESLKV